MVSKQVIGKEKFLNQKEKIGRSMLLSSLGALKSSEINRKDCILVPTQSGWILHMPLAKQAKDAIP